MKLGILSDIHTDINYSGGDHVTPALCGEIHRRGLDALIIAGDMAGDYTISSAVIRTLRREAGIPCMFVPGNHDIWTENHPNLDSWTIYHRLAELDGNLAAGPVDLEDEWTVIGDLGWFDFRFADRRFTPEELSAMEYGGRQWQDHIYALWGRPPEEMHRFFYKKLEKQLKETAGRKVVLVTHMVQADEFTVKEDHPQAELWKYFNAFLGSPDYGLLAEKFPQVKLSISGHVHYRKQFTRGDTLFVCNCLGYSSEWDGTDDPRIEIPKALLTVDTDDLP